MPITQARPFANPKEVVTSTPAAPITIIREVPQDLDEYVPKPHLPRATLAVSKEHPHGTEDYETHGFSVLQQHVAFFDRNHDGIVYPWETYAGFRAIGFNIFFTLMAVTIIHGAFSYVTLDGWLPSPLFAIVIKNIHKAKHGSDSEIYDSEGRFVPEKFEGMFSKHDIGNKGGLDFFELLRFLKTNRNVYDFFGWFAAIFEWGTLWWLAANNGLLSKEAVRGQYDGSFFYEMERRMKEKGD